jgi:hypothetical protein
MTATFYRNARPLRERPSQGSAKVDPGRDIAGHPSVPGYGEPRRDFNGSPADEFDGSHLSPEARARVRAMPNQESAGKVIRPASVDPAGDGMRHFAARAEPGWPSFDEQRRRRLNPDPAQGGPGDFCGPRPRKSMRRV